MWMKSSRRINKYRYLEDRLVLVPIAVILVSMAEITWDLASRFTILRGQPITLSRRAVSAKQVQLLNSDAPVWLKHRLRRFRQKAADLYDFAVYSLER